MAAGEALLSQQPGALEGPSAEAWRLRLEGVAREIDATFAPAAMPEAVSALRSRIVGAIGGAAT